MSRLPNFLYVGPDKAGSSWLHEMLLKHPEVYLTPAKDLYYFDRYYDRGPAWYASQFRDARDETVVGEVCQDYLFHPEAATRIPETLGRCAVMVSLRDPVERAWSSYLYMRKHGIWPEHLRRGPADPARAARARPLRHRLDRFLATLLARWSTSPCSTTWRPTRRRFLDAVTDFLGIDRLPLADKDLEARLPAARARSVRIASVARRSADWVREHDGATLVGTVKRSPLVQRVLYRPIDRETVRPDPEDVMTVRTALAPEIEALESRLGLRLTEAWGW